MVERNATAIVADSDAAIFHINADDGLLGESGVEFVDTVVHHLLDEHIDAIVALRAVAKFANIHTRAQTDMLTRGEGDQFVVTAIVAGLLCAIFQFEFFSHYCWILILEKPTHCGQLTYKFTNFFAHSQLCALNCLI